MSPRIGTQQTIERNISVKETKIPDIIAPDYPTLFFFETGEWWDYAMLIVVTAALAVTAWFAQRGKQAVLLLFIIVPVGLAIFWWPYSTQSVTSTGWFPIVKRYSAPAGSLCLVALQYVPRFRYSRWYLLVPPTILTLNIVEAVLYDFQYYNIRGIDPTQGMVIWDGPWNIMNDITGILNVLMVSGQVGIFVAKGKSKAVVQGDLTLWWIIAYDAQDSAYCYNCLADRAWYSALTLLAACMIPAFLGSSRGSWIQYRTCTLTFWSAVVLTFPRFIQDSAFAHRSACNPTAMFLVSALAFIVNIGVTIYHFHTIARTCRNPFTQELYTDTPTYAAMIRNHTSKEDQDLIATRMGSTATALGYR